MDIPVFIDGGAPVPTCSFPESEITNTGARLPTHVGFQYGATDSCGKPLNVTVDVYASEIEDFNAQEMVLLFRNRNANDATEVYLAANICPTSNNGHCIKDPAALDAILYTVIVKAIDTSRNAS